MPDATRVPSSSGAHLACYACDLIAGRVPLPGGRVHETPHWIVEHCTGPFGVGALIVKPRRLVQPVSNALRERFEEAGPSLQVEMFRRNEVPRVDLVETFCEKARAAFRSA